MQQRRVGVEGRERRDNARKDNKLSSSKFESGRRQYFGSAIQSCLSAISALC